MPKILSQISLCFVFLLIACTSHAGSPVWLISKGQQQLYLGGTFHLLAKSDHPLPEAFDTAYARAAQVVLETDISIITSPDFQQKMAMAMMLGDGRTLKSELAPETFQALSDYFSSRSLSITNFMPFSPAGVALTITVLEYQQLGMMPDAGVDYVFAKRAASDNKVLGHLETPEEQLEFVTNLGKGREDALMMHTLREIENMEASITQLKSAWRRGDLAKMESLAMTPMREQFPNIYASLLADRNRAWMPKIEAMLNDAPIEFVLVGALHLVGEDGVLEQLRAKGYKIENL